MSGAPGHRAVQTGLNERLPRIIATPLASYGTASHWPSGEDARLMSCTTVARVCRVSLPDPRSQIPDPRSRITNRNPQPELGSLVHLAIAPFARSRANGVVWGPENRRAGQTTRRPDDQTTRRPDDQPRPSGLSPGFGSDHTTHGPLLAVQHRLDPDSPPSQSPPSPPGPL
jgi:hypothetical protein